MELQLVNFDKAGCFLFSNLKKISPCFTAQHSIHILAVANPILHLTKRPITSDWVSRYAFDISILADIRITHPVLTQSKSQSWSSGRMHAVYVVDWG